MLMCTCVQKDDCSVADVESDEFEEGTDDNVVVVTVAPGDESDEPSYACLLPLSSGMCKSFKVPRLR